ncbi:MAG TPA: DinB family protein [Thermoanaerobaculia bacterium]|nr:DinB family protein [Thermoanaerobaculia bacterium]
MTDFQGLLAYDAWADREVVASLRAAADPPPKALKLLAHLVGAGRLWLARLEGSREKPPAVWPELSLDDAAAGVEELAARWRRFLNGRPELERAVSYVNSKGEPWTSSVGDILMHVVIHGGYHRGQIASELRAAGFTPAYTDYIEAVRRKLV